MPRTTRNTGPQTPHQAAAAAARSAQVQHPQAPLRAEGKTDSTTTTNRHVSIRFNPGHDWETEVQVAAAFHRPPRTYKTDPPFYPWLPPEPYVNFHLNYKF